MVTSNKTLCVNMNTTLIIITNNCQINKETGRDRYCTLKDPNHCSDVLKCALDSYKIFVLNESNDRDLKNQFQIESCLLQPSIHYNLRRFYYKAYLLSCTGKSSMFISKTSKRVLLISSWDGGFSLTVIALLQRPRDTLIVCGGNHQEVSEGNKMLL